MDAEARLDEVRRRRGVSEAAVAGAVEVGEPEDDFYVAALARYVAALGGYIEVRAVFPEETVTLLREPGSPGSPA
jgi:hypothetical protein